MNVHIRMLRPTHSAENGAVAAGSVIEVSAERARVLVDELRIAEVAEAPASEPTPAPEPAPETDEQPTRTAGEPAPDAEPAKGSSKKA
jgi:hypothetical protein